MPRFSRPPRAAQPGVPAVPYYAEGELVRERVLTETLEPQPVAVVRDGNGLSWLLLIPLVVLLVVVAYLFGRDSDDDPAGQTPVVQPTVVVSQAPEAPPVVVNPPPVVVKQPPVVVEQPAAPSQAPAPAQSAAPEPAAPQSAAPAPS